MKKKELINKIVELIDIVNGFQRQINELKSDNDEIRAKLRQLEEKCKETVEVPLTEQPENNEVVEASEQEPQEKKIEENKPLKAPVKVRAVKVTLQDDALEYGSVAIGRLVQESMKYANLISISSADDKKELVNLIMGKAEVVKAEIFSITEGQLSADVKKELIDTQIDEAIDYFKSAYGQIAQ